MITTISENEFINAFKQSDTRKDEFSYEALKALYEYYNELEDDLGEQIEFDMVAICCEWTEYKTFKEIQDVYNDSDNIEIESLEDLQANTTVIPLKSVYEYYNEKDENYEYYNELELVSGYLVQEY